MATMIRCKYEGLVTDEQCRTCWQKCLDEKPKWFVALTPENIRQCRKLNTVELPEKG